MTLPGSLTGCLVFFYHFNCSRYERQDQSFLITAYMQRGGDPLEFNLTTERNNTKKVAALKRLPEKKRGIILMLYFLDMSEEETAEYMKLVQSTVHYHKVDSLRLLRKILE